MNMVKIITVSRYSSYYEIRDQIEGQIFFLISEENPDDKLEGTLLRIQDPLFIVEKKSFTIICEKYEEITDGYAGHGKNNNGKPELTILGKKKSD
jgi:hypothetical protein